MAITVKHTKVSTIPDGDDSSLIRPSDWNAEHQLVGTVPPANGGTGASTLNGYVFGNGTSAMTASVTIPNTDITGLGTASTKDAGMANGVATLDAGGKVPVSQIPQLGDLNYQGTWNATTNTPTLTSSVGTKGYYYVVDVAGSTNLNGITDWKIGDWAVYNGSVWQKIDNTDAVTSVNGYTGTVVLTAADVSAIAKIASATDNAIARFDGTTGGLVQNSVVTIDDNGNQAGINSINFDTTPSTVPTTPGSLYWDSANGNQTLSLVMANGDAIQQIGEEQYFRIRASAAITEGQVVMFTGTVGGSGALTGAPASGLTASTASYVMGIATHNLAINDWGYITSFGLVRGINTTGGAESWVDGQILYYDPTVAGGLTKTVPVAPNAKIQVCAVVNAASGGSGSVFVRSTFGGALGQYEGDVQVTTPANGDLLIRNETAGKWVNAPLTAGTGISVTNTAGAVTITNTAPSSGGTVTSVSGTAPVSVATGTTTPVISMAAATTSVDGYLTSTDWNTFNNKGSGTVTSVAALTLGTTGTDLSSTVATGTTTPVITLQVPTASATNRGALSSTDWSTFNGKQAALVSGTNIKTVNGASLLGSGDVGTIGVAYGGTGATTATGSGSVVLQTSPTITTPTIDKINTSVANTSLGAGNASIMKNRIINGAMVIDQRNAGASVTPVNAGYTLDRWFFSLSQASKLTCQQNAGSVTPPVGFTNYLGVTSSSAYSVGASELFVLRQNIEGFNVADLGWGTANAKTITVSFWVRSSLTGTFGGTFRNSAGNRFYPFSYTITTANTWEYETITIAGDTSGTWATNNTSGIELFFSLGSGSTVSGTAGSWGSTVYYSATGATSVVGTSGATFYITGVQLEVGTSATGFEYRQYQQELALCQRYYARFNALASTTARVGTNSLPVPMRASPTVAATFDAGTGATYTPLTSVPGTSLFQDTAHSQIATANVTANIEL